MLPRRLTGRAAIGLIAPSGFVAENVAIRAAVEYFEGLGHRVVLGDALESRWKYFSAPDDTRLASLNGLVADPDIDMIMAVRGGYGLTRILPDLDFPAMARSGKIFVGFSDFTIFHLAALARAGMVSFAGPMAVVDFGCAERSRFTEEHFWSLLRSPAYSIEDIHYPNSYPAQTIEGTIWGGTLSLIVHLVGTPWFPAIDDGILFVEDVNEEPYHLERMLFQLLHAGILARQRAILVGAMNGCVPGTKSRAPYSVDDVLQTLAARLDQPVLGALPYGHVKDKITLPIGAKATLRLDERRYSIRFSEYVR